MTIEISNLHFGYGDKRIFTDFSAVFSSEKPVCIMGASGCGKTTLLSLIMGLLKPEQGSITGVPDRFSAVFQEDRLLENFSARANLNLVTPKKLTERETETELSDLGMGDAIEKPLKEFSGGMKQRVAIARAMLAPGGAVFMDEPFKGLDDRARELTVQYIKDRLNGRLLVFVSHSAEDAEALGAEILQL